MVAEISRRAARLLAEDLMLTSYVSGWILQPIWILLVPITGDKPTGLYECLRRLT